MFRCVLSHDEFRFEICLEEKKEMGNGTSYHRFLKKNPCFWGILIHLYSVPS